ncbi:hypothetical protein L195_g018490 [Trifolium pratense]|uniref:Uncharacterized protein n=1 Tax=Trifolium pratense TaxID=57577 RepID=A0A2K3MWW2_TRIPR|nr:hypothetical protein L195_g018490 [Trifolium pratense]
MSQAEDEGFHPHTEILEPPRLNPSLVPLNINEEQHNDEDAASNQNFDMLWKMKDFILTLRF